MSSFHLSIITSERNFFEDEVDKIIADGTEGQLAILKDKSPLLCQLKEGNVKIFIEGKEKIAHILDGYLKVMNNHAVIITSNAKWM